MPMRIAAPLLSLIGHELRAPAGVVGGYLALVEQGRDRLTGDQQKALVGARKAQQAMVEALDDLRRLTMAWRSETEPLTWVPLPALAADVAAAAAARRVPLTVQSQDVLVVPRRGRDAGLVEARVAVAEAVSREHGVPVTATTVATSATLTWRIRPGGAAPDDEARARPFDLWRPGMGVRLVAGVVTIVASHGVVTDLHVGEARHGVDVFFDLHAATAPPPAPVDLG